MCRPPWAIWEATEMTRGSRQVEPRHVRPNSAWRAASDGNAAADKSLLARATALSRGLNAGPNMAAEQVSSPAKRRFGRKSVLCYAAALVGAYAVGLGVMVALTNHLH